ncbi:hypothetical protein HOK68_03555 [Candidatus Woesearchaeota archaeon]|nr:hypothetical protein [Candidatus Woesearchaeota archaeon]MBT4387391.1 hypothetical protein [Candidatus Woesearchaeota archaeon]MBT4595529.1 hypothetical protein [Candidatus Woesearchaeota archaeon]MBT5740988.1 hypothetical protein [Candidatus Woesearchaeota archaeon]MBT6505828.1 hypothetical protein [Candidatus Woesearchaeota archaeon]
MRGRPKGSKIRQNVINILYFYSPLTGYDIFKKYIKIYGRVTSRSIYYHLKYGTNIGDFEINKIINEKGNFSWGESSQKIYYNLTGGAIADIDDNIKDYYNNDKQ